MSPLGRDWFRSNGSKHGNSASQHGKNSENNPSGANVAKSLISQEDLELEYLNEISRLTREKEDARDEIERQSRDNESLNSSLRDSNQTLQLKVAALESKLLESNNISSQGYGTSDEVDSLKSKLAKYNETNKMLHNKIQKLKQRRRDGEDDASEISSVGSLSLLSYQTRSSTKQIANNLLELQNKYDDELGRNKDLQEKLHIAEVNKVSFEKKLCELKTESSNALKTHLKETETLQNDLHEAKEELIKLKSVQGGVDQNNNQVRAELEQSQLKVLDLEKEMVQKKRDIEGLEVQVRVNNDAKIKVEQLSAEIDQLKEEVNTKTTLIETLKVEKQRNEQDLKQLNAIMAISRESEETAQKELDKLKEANTVERSKTPEIGNTQQETKITKDLKEALDALQKRYTEEALFNASLKEELKQLRDSNKVVDTSLHTVGTSLSDVKNPVKDVENLNAALKSKEEHLKAMNDEMIKTKRERESLSSTLQSVETTLVEIKLKNAQQMEELDDLKIQLQQKNKLCEELENMKNNGTDHNQGTGGDNERVRELEKAITKKDIEIKILEAKSRDVLQMSEQLKKVEKELKEKEKELGTIKTEKHESTMRLETLELDFVVTQQKGAKTWEELEDLKEKYKFEQTVKSDLQNKLKKMDSVDKLLGETKRLSEATLRDRDKEIEKLKKQLTEANIAKKATEKKLIAYKNDSVAQESSRDLMKQELENQLKDENEKALQLESLIVSKEEDIERIRKEFDVLFKNMQNELQKKRNQVTELNGEVLEVSNQLASKDRDLQYLKGQIEDFQLKHSSEIARLNRELDASVDKVELERLRSQNADLEQTILTLNQEIGKLRALFASHPDEESEGSIKVLRARNEKLKKDIEKLARKLYQMKKGRQEI